MVIALSILAAYLAVAAVIAVLARRAWVPLSIGVLAGLAWGPVMAGVVISNALKRLRAAKEKRRMETNYTLPSPLDAEEPLVAFYNESDTWIAHSAADAHAMYLDNIGAKTPADSDVKPEDWIQLYLGKKMTINLDDGRGVIRKTVAEWIASEGRGFLCSDDY